MAALALVATTLSDVLMRTVAHRAVNWAFDLQTQYLMIALYFLTVAYAQRQRTHIAIEIGQPLISRFGGRVWDVIVDALSLVFIGILTYWTFVSFWRSWLSQELGEPTLPWPVWTSEIIVVLGFALTGLRLLIQIIDQVVEIARTDVSREPALLEEEI
nr:TRAP transporter small permease [Brevibacterium luteolum]